VSSGDGTTEKLRSEADHFHAKKVEARTAIIADLHVIYIVFLTAPWLAGKILFHGNAIQLRRVILIFGPCKL
jgi:hypothetical protein